MRYTIVNKEDKLSLEIVSQIKAILNNKDWNYDEKKPQVVISVGGDGTMLRAVHKYMPIIDEVNFIGIHTGTLGFFTNYTSHEVEKMCNNLVSVSPHVEEYKLLEIMIDNEKILYAVNELRVENNHHTQEIEVFINSEYLQTFKGNGICLSSTIGSTGYNRSLRGPIIENNLDLMIMTEIAAIQHRYFSTLNSPLVMGNNTNFTMKFHSTDYLLIGIDHDVIEEEVKSNISCRISNKTFKMLSYNEYSYVERLKKAFLE